MDVGCTTRKITCNVIVGRLDRCMGLGWKREMHEVRWCMQVGVAVWVRGGGWGKVSEGGKGVHAAG